MNLQTIIKELNQTMSLREIAEQCGLASAGHAHDLLTGRRTRVMYETGVKINELHRRKMQQAKRRKGPAILQKQE